MSAWHFWLFAWSSELCDKVAYLLHVSGLLLYRKDLVDPLTWCSQDPSCPCWLKHQNTGRPEPLCEGEFSHVCQQKAVEEVIECRITAVGILSCCSVLQLPLDVTIETYLTDNQPLITNNQAINNDLQQSKPLLPRKNKSWKSAYQHGTLSQQGTNIYTSEMLVKWPETLTFISFSPYVSV